MFDISNMSSGELRHYSRMLNQENKQYGPKLLPIDFPERITPKGKRLIELWRSRDFLCQVYDEGNHIERLSICRASVDVAKGRWRDGIKWEELQQIKLEVGRGEFDAVEVFPKESDVIDVANMRHLWVLRAVPLSFAWRKK